MRKIYFILVAIAICALGIFWKMPEHLSNAKALNVANHTTISPKPVVKASSFSKKGVAVSREDSSAPCFRNTEEVWALGIDLSESELEPLYQLIGQHNPPKGMHPQDFYAIKDAVMALLKEQKRTPLKLTSTLVALYRDHAQDEVTRNYAVQHLSTWYEQAGEKEDIGQLLWESLAEKQTSIAGTSLLALERLQREDASIDSNRLESETLQMLLDSNTTESSRIAAIQLCGKLNLDQEALPTLLEIAKTGKTISLRTAAIGSLGLLANDASVPYLQEMSRSSDERLRVAAQEALKRIRNV
jgi:hypothetical protein